MKTIESISSSLLGKYSAIYKERRKLPETVGTIAVTFFKRSFRRQGFLNNGLQKWNPRKGEKVRGANTKKKDKESRGILIGKGTGDKLSRSIRIEQKSFFRIVITSPKVYAEIHNSGLMGKAFGKYSFKMPKRQFMGKSTELNKQTIDLIKKRFNFIFKNVTK
jgi:phage gpG-like protein